MYPHFGDNRLLELYEQAVKMTAPPPIDEEDLDVCMTGYTLWLGVTPTGLGGYYTVKQADKSVAFGIDDDGIPWIRRV